MKQLQKKSSNLKTLNIIASDNIELILDELNLRYYNHGRYITMACPIHNGDNPTAINIYTDGDYSRGNWVCNTRHCEQKFIGSFLGFIRGVLSSIEQKRVTVEYTVGWICSVLEIDYYNLKPIESKHKDFYSLTKTFEIEHKHSPLPKLDLKIPSQYYLDRGYPADLLKRYEIGDCYSGQFKDRAVFPVYDDEHKIIVGYTGRTNRNDSAKWISNFSTDSYLFNYWFAKDSIKNSRTVIIVEGPGDVLRLEQYGVHNSVATLGTKLTDYQQILLERSGAMNVKLMFDNDEPGKIITEKAQKLLNRIYNVSIINVNKDPGELTKEECKCLL